MIFAFLIAVGIALGMFGILHAIATVHQAVLFWSFRRSVKRYQAARQFGASDEQAKRFANWTA